MPAPRITATSISKSFPGVRALDRVSLTLMPGEVLAIVGENGAGKSTLMKILAGVYQPDDGQITLDGAPVQFPDPASAMRAGISLIHQELNLAENLTVSENLFLGREPTIGGFLRIIARGTSTADGASLLSRVGLPATLLNRPVSELSPGQKQLVEIARALGLKARVLIMDEPTSSLTQTETDRLYDVIERLKADGVSILYISHRLAEIRRIADRALVLRDGRNAGELARSEITHDALVRLMVGRELTSYFPRTRGMEAGSTVLSLRNITLPGRAPVSFDLRAGEVLGMAGLMGAGRTELAEAVCGLREMVAGDVFLNGVPLHVAKPADAIAAGILLIPEDRRHHGLTQEATVGFNLSLPNLDRLTTSTVIQRTAERTFHAEWISRLKVKTPNPDTVVGQLSGGNQQKIVFAKWLARSPKVLILDEPTRGVDVGAKAEIYGLIDELAGRGVAVWMISSDLEELLGMADRVIAVHEGRIGGELPRDRLSEEAVMTLATGGAA